MNQPMRQPSGHDFDQDLARALASGRDVPCPGFADRAVQAIGADRRRRTLLRWGSGVTTAAACFLAVFVLQGRGDDSLAQRADALAASDESRQLSDILGFADELSLLTPAIDPHSVVEALINPDL
jgi:hypothetical protein